MSEISKLLETYHPRYEAQLQFLDVSFIIKSHTRELIDKVMEYFGPWLSEAGKESGHVIHTIIGEASIDRDRLVDVVPRPGKRVKEAYYDDGDCRVVLKKRTGVVVYICGKDRYIIGNLLEHFNQLVNQIGELYVQHYISSGYLLLHGSSVMDGNGRALVFASESGTGKSTLAVALLERGFVYLSNDRVLLKAGCQSVDVLGVPKKPRVNPGTIMVLPSLHRLLSADQIVKYSVIDRDELWNLEKKYDVDISDIFGIRSVGLRGTLGALYFLDWHRGGEGFSIVSVSPEEAAELLRPNVLNLDPSRKEFNLSEVVEHGVTRILHTCPLLLKVCGAVSIDKFADYLKDSWQS